MGRKCQFQGMFYQVREAANDAEYRNTTRIENDRFDISCFGKFLVNLQSDCML